MITVANTIRTPRPPVYDERLALLREAACRCDTNAAEKRAVGDRIGAAQADRDANDLWQHARAVRFDGAPLDPTRLRFARAVVAGD